jgi:indole-3-glycerol phosphate synthase
MNILEQIIDAKKRQVAMEQAQTPLAYWERQPEFERPTLSLAQSVRDTQKTGIIAEFKRKSPSKGMINEFIPVARVTEAYTAGGASGLSVLTDTVFFGGSIRDLKDARFNELPILRKDFIIDEYQVIQSKAIGADVILLIAACLSPAKVKVLARLARSLQLEVLLEVHNEKEIEYVTNDIHLVGVNNRDLKTFSVSVQRSIELEPVIRKKCRETGIADPVLISESGISDATTIENLRQYGYEGFLVGEHFMKQKDPASAFSEFVKSLKVKTGSIEPE